MDLAQIWGAQKKDLQSLVRTKPVKHLGGDPGGDLKKGESAAKLLAFTSQGCVLFLEVPFVVAFKGKPTGKTPFCWGPLKTDPRGSSQLEVGSHNAAPRLFLVRGPPKCRGCLSPRLGSANWAPLPRLSRPSYSGKRP